MTVPMSSYLVLHRMVADKIHLPGEILVDPVNAGILMERGFITPVPDGFTAPPQPAEERAAERAAAVEEAKEADEDSGTTETTEATPPTIEEALESGYSQEAAEVLAAGETSALVDEETARIDEILSARPEALRIAKALDVSLTDVSELSDAEYADALEAYPAES